jgi:glycosyltransferase involved in cell wall biosynthesis
VNAPAGTRLRIAFLTWRDTGHPDGGGSELFVESIARELVRRGHQVTIFCARHPGAPARESIDGVDFVRAGARLSVYPRGLLWLLRRSRNLDVVVDVINGLPFAVPLVRRRAAVALVHHLHEEQWRIIYPGLRGRIGWFIESRVVPRLYARMPMLTVSEASRRDLVRIGFAADAVRVVHNGVDRASVTAQRSPTPRLVVVTRLVPHKRIEHAFDLVAQLADRHPALHLDVIGEGWWRPELERTLARSGVSSRVTLHGRLSDDERDALLAQAWALVLPSVREGWGIVVLEAAAQGTPAVVYRGAGGVEEAVVDGRTGLVVDGFEELVRQVDVLLNDEGLRSALGRAARERAREFTWVAATDRVEALFGEVAADEVSYLSP